MVAGRERPDHAIGAFQYSLCRVVLMVVHGLDENNESPGLSVLALSSRFDGLEGRPRPGSPVPYLSVLALSSRFDGLEQPTTDIRDLDPFSTRSVESF